MKKVLSTPLRNDIRKNKRKSIPKPKKVLSTPLRKAIESIEPRPEMKIMDQILQKSIISKSKSRRVRTEIKKVLPTPLKKDIKEFERPPIQAKPVDQSQKIIDSKSKADENEATTSKPVASAPSIEELSKLRVVDLRAKMSKLNLNKKGRKAELVKRLHEYYSVQLSIPSQNTECENDVESTQQSTVESNVVETVAEEHNEETQDNRTKKDLQKLRVVDLRAELKEKGLDTKGLKRVLIERLYKHIHGQSSTSSTDTEEASNQKTLNMPSKRMTRSRSAKMRK
eukprot:jgi/Bigna1/64110/fgenesh1_kg.67_\